MKKILFFSLVLFTVACKKNEKKFKGLWMVFKVEKMNSKITGSNEDISGLFNGTQIIDLRGKNSGLDSFMKINDSRLFSFEKGHLLLDDINVFGQGVSSWQLSDDEKKLILKSGRKTETFDIYKIKENAIVLRQYYEPTNDSLLFTIVPFKGEKAPEFTKSFEYLVNKPQQPETDEQIKERLKHALLFYSNYFHTIDEDKQVNSFNTTHIFLPIQFYNGGIEIKPFSADADWVYLFYNIQDAAKAHSFMIAALQKIGVFPSRGNRFALEYSEIFKEMAGNVY